MEGIVKRIPEGKSFGFIKADRSEYFFHADDFEGSWTALALNVNKNEKPILVSFEVIPSNRGPRASGVRLI